MDGGPLEGARVCIANHGELPCALADSSGKYAVELPAWSEPVELAVNISAPGHLGFTGLVADFEIFNGQAGPRPSAWWPNVGLAGDLEAAAWLGAEAGLRFPAPDRAFVRVSTNAPVGSTLHLMPGDGVRAVYADEMFVWQPALTSLSRSGSVLFGEVPPGRFEVTALGCEEVVGATLSSAVWDAQDQAPNTVAGFAVPGSLTQVLLVCNR